MIVSHHCMAKRIYTKTLMQTSRPRERTLEVGFACFVTCIFDQGVSNDAIANLRIPGFEIQCIRAAVNSNRAVEAYVECDGLPLTKLLRVLEDMGMCCVAIFTFGSHPRTNGAPEALARIRFRIERCEFAGYSKGTPSVEESGDFDIRDDHQSSWVRFTADQMGLMLATDGSKPHEIVEWCVVVCSGDCSRLEEKLKVLNIATGQCRQYYVKGVECMRLPMAARIYLEIEPIVKTSLLRCLCEELGAMMTVEIMTFPHNQQARALAFVFEQGGLLFEQGNLSDVVLSNSSPCIITRFTQKDLAIWDCVVNESPSLHWSVVERDADLARLKAEISVLRMENSLLRNESAHCNQQIGRLLSAMEEIKADRAHLRKELDFRASVGSDGLVGWSEWEMMRTTLEDKDRCILQLRTQLAEANNQVQKLQRGEMVLDDQGRWVCVSGDLSGLGQKIKLLEERLESEFEGGLVFDEERNKLVETDGRTWTRVQWQARELDVYRTHYGSIDIRNCFNEPDFCTGASSFENA